MANIFLDTNILIDLYGRDKSRTNQINQHNSYISPLSCHILAYTNKIKIPNSKLNHLLENIGIVNLTQTILERSLSGPTDDLEDNIQLNSAAESDCQYFLTNDKFLLKIAYFGKMQIVNSL